MKIASNGCRWASGGCSRCRWASGGCSRCSMCRWVSESAISASATGAKVAVRHCTGSGNKEIVFTVIQCQGFGIVIEVFLNMGCMNLQDP